MDAANPKNLISNLIAPASVQLHLRGTDRDAVLTELVGLVPDLAQRPTDRERLLAALLERERMHSTGIGDGVALPHTRDTLGDVVSHPLIVFGRHPSGVGFGAIDGKPVRLFFLLVTTSITQHLQTLARISRVLRDARLRQALLGAETSAAVLEAIRRAENGA